MIFAMLTIIFSTILVIGIYRYIFKNKSVEPKSSNKKNYLNLILFVFGVLFVVCGFILLSEVERKQNNYYDRANNLIDGRYNYNQDLSDMSSLAGVLIIIGGSIGLLGLFRLVFNVNNSKKLNTENISNLNDSNNQKQQNVKKLYYYNDGSIQFGPFDLMEIRNKRLSSNYFIWFEGLNEWKRASQIVELEGFLENTPPPFDKKA